MSVTKTVSTIDTEAVITSADKEELPKDINLEKRKNIMRDQLNKLIGKPRAERNFLEKQRLKQRDFNKKKIRRKIALKSQKRNW